ncbi:MAG: DNA-binding response regulator [Bacteroidetes bacterium HGW-Bacteroidetes-5]|jgi:DNA-binding LytR/AlgR family response regulator|nr:MAG: DNA-binding response regulator [Bacteroidetes bacterium HGW-Bacteroidetes-5]
MNVLIIEDEVVAAGKLEQMLVDADPSVRVLAKLGSIKESVQWLLHNSAELIFLDIQLSDGISFSIFEQVTVNTPVIFTTAYDQYAVKAFKLNSISYLLKPIRESDLKESLGKYKSLKMAFGIDFDSLLSQIQGREPEYKKRFLIQTGNKIKKVESSEIAYCFVADKGVYIRTFEGQTLVVDYTLDKLQELLNPGQFFRINRKYMVNIESISNMVAYSRARVKLELKPKADSQEDTIVSIDRSADFKRWMNS